MDCKNCSFNELRDDCEFRSYDKCHRNPKEIMTCDCATCRHPAFVNKYCSRYPIYTNTDLKVLINFWKFLANFMDITINFNKGSYLEIEFQKNERQTEERGILWLRYATNQLLFIGTVCSGCGNTIHYHEDAQGNLYNCAKEIYLNQDDITILKAPICDECASKPHLCQIYLDNNNLCNVENKMSEKRWDYLNRSKRILFDGHWYYEKSHYLNFYGEFDKTYGQIALIKEDQIFAVSNLVSSLIRYTEYNYKTNIWDGILEILQNRFEHCNILRSKGPALLLEFNNKRFWVIHCPQLIIEHSSIIDFICDLYETEDDDDDDDDCYEEDEDEEEDFPF